MKKFNVAILLLAVVLVVGTLSLYMSARIGRQAARKDQVYLVIKTVSENIEFWTNVQNGAEVAAIELGVEVIVDGPLQEIYIEDQIAMMEEIILKKPEAIAIAASDYNALAEVCEKAVEAGIILVTYDSDANMTSDHSFVATNNLSASQRIAHELGTLMNGQGAVAIVSHVEGVFTAIERIQGFERGIRPFKDIEILPEVYYSDNNESKAYDAAVNILHDYPEVSALFGTNEVALAGIGKAVRDLGVEDEILVVGFDINEDIVLMIEQGIIDGSMVQKPFNMGYIAVREALEVLAGKEPSVIDTGVVMINKENMFLPENQKLIVP